MHWKIDDEVEVIKLCEKVIGWNENFQLKLRGGIEPIMGYRPQNDNFYKIQGKSHSDTSAEITNMKCIPKDKRFLGK